MAFPILFFLVVSAASCGAFSTLSTSSSSSQSSRSRIKYHDNNVFVLKAAAAAAAEPLIPEENPDFDPNAKSLSGVSFGAVLHDLLTPLYPPTELEKRNALSRTDGYWPFIHKGKDPPKQFTYGEFDFYFFAQLLDKAREYYSYNHLPLEETTGNNEESGSGWTNKVFYDIGSGTGRLVLAAAALHPWRVCRGVELLPKIHQAALDKYQLYQDNLQQQNQQQQHQQQQQKGPETTTTQLATTPCDFICGSFDDPYVYFGDADCIFVFSSCMSSDLLTKLAAAVGRQCRPGTIIMTTDYMLPLEGFCDPVTSDTRVPFGPYEFELVEKVDGWCWLTGGGSTAYIHRVKTSVNQNGPLAPPEVSLEDKALQVIKSLESGELADPKQFLRGVYNNMAFHGIPERLRPNLESTTESTTTTTFNIDNGDTDDYDANNKRWF